jgi:glutathione S-transferase
MAAQSTGPRPRLWHLEVSHYSEKARWALDHKRVPHRRRLALPGTHMAIAMWLTGGAQVTFPVLEVDGGAIGDSTAVIAALEDRYPERPLYPADPEERARALALEEFFDEELGPRIRHLVFYELINEPRVFGEVGARTVPGPLGRSELLVGTYARLFTSARFGANDAAGAELARERVGTTMDRLETELEAGDGEHLVGSEFSVADLTAAALFYPLVIPEGGPVPPEQPRPAAFDEFRATLSDRPGWAWVEQTYRRHRHPGGMSAVGA